MSNGYLDPRELVAADGFAPYPAGPNFSPVSETTLSNLGKPALVQDWHALRAAAYADLGVWVTYAELYRPYGVQVARKREQGRGGPLAAAPGTSPHGDAEAIDGRNQLGTKGSPFNVWMHANGARFGFVKTTSEEWHWVHPSDRPVYTGTISGAGTGVAITPEDEDDMSQADKDNATAALTMAAWSDDERTHARLIVTNQYKLRLGRGPDSAGMRSGLRIIALGGDAADVDKWVMSSAEYQSKH